MKGRLLSGVLALTLGLSLALSGTAFAGNVRGMQTSNRALSLRTGDNGYGRVMVTNRNILPASNPRSSMNMSDPKQGQRLMTGSSLTQPEKNTVTTNGRNLAVPESFENAEKQITVRTLPRSSMNPKGILNLPDNGKELKELLPAPEGEDNTAEDNPTIDSDTAEEIEDEASPSSRYPYVSIHGNVTSEQYNEFSTYMDKLIAEYPDLVEEAVRKGWTVILAEEELDDLLFDGKTNGVEGATYFPQNGSNGTVYVHAGEHSYCVIHEFGHVLDSLSGYPSQGSGFKDIFERESANLTEYGQSSQLEFFAEIFMYGMLQPETTKQACPDACEFVGIYLSDIKEGAA